MDRNRLASRVNRQPRRIRWPPLRPRRIDSLMTVTTLYSGIIYKGTVWPAMALTYADESLTDLRVGRPEANRFRNMTKSF